MEPIPIIDVHHHIIPDIYRQVLQKNGITHSGGKRIASWTPEDSIAHMDALGVSTGICSLSEPALYPIVERSRQDARLAAREINLYMAELCDKYPGRFGAFAILPLPDVESALDEIDYALGTLHLDGVGLLSNYQNRYLGDDYFSPVFDKLQEYHAPVYIHPSVPPADLARPEYLCLDYMAEFCFNTTRAGANLILSGTMERCPDIKPILSHMGGTLPYLCWRIDSCHTSLIQKEKSSLVSENVWDGWNSLKKPCMDYLKLFYFDTALATHPAAFFAVQSMSVENILFGSDSFYAPLEKGKLFTREIKNYFNEAEQKAVYYQNAQKLFPRFSK